MEKKLRLRYAKTGKAKYISHLDMMSTMRRALLRAGLELEYSKGFNPHPYLSVALPLPVGCESVCELIDVGLAGENLYSDLPGKISACLPEGLEVLEAYPPVRKFNDITWIGISIMLHYDNPPSIDIAKMLTERFAAEKIIISKKTKRGISDIDIAPFIKETAVSHEFPLTLTAKVFAVNPTITPDNLISAINEEYKELAPDFTTSIRMELFDKDMNIFR